MMRRNWSQEEDIALNQIVQEVGDNDWSTVARLLQHQCQSGRGNRRTGKQCRERWYNQLNPSINKNQWTTEEETRLFEVQKLYGNKWKEISKFLPGRTDNDIKNKFYSTLRRSLRRLNKLVGRKNSTGEIREIKPSVLASIINFAYVSQNSKDQYTQALKSIPSLIFKFSNFKPVRKNMKQELQQQVKINIDIIFKLIQSFKEHQQHPKNSQESINIDPNGIEVENPFHIEKDEDSQNLQLNWQQRWRQGKGPRTITPIIICFPAQGLYLHREEVEKQLTENICHMKKEDQSNSLENQITNIAIVGCKIQLPKGQAYQRSQQIIHYN